MTTAEAVAHLRHVASICSMPTPLWEIADRLEAKDAECKAWRAEYETRPTFKLSERPRCMSVSQYPKAQAAVLDARRRCDELESTT
jgi:hypothetical protein